MTAQANISWNQIGYLFNNRKLNLIVFPTEKCNFRCSYCYESYDHGRMKPAVLSAIKLFLHRRFSDLETIQLSWFGGEPLLAKDIVIDLSSYILEHKGPSVSYHADMTTNGYLLDRDTAKHLISLGVTAFQVSLDGFGAQHDITRQRADGFGTFERIWANLLALRELELSYHMMIRVHCSPANIAVLDDLIQAINRDFGSDTRFTVFFKSISKLGGSNDEKLEIFDKTEARMIKATLEQKLLSSRQISPINVDDFICYASKPNSLIIRADGSVAKCTVALYDERNRVGQLQPDGRLDIDQPLLRPWLRGFSTLEKGDLACPYNSMLAESSGGTEHLVPLRLPT